MAKREKHPDSPKVGLKLGVNLGVTKHKKAQPFVYQMIALLLCGKRDFFEPFITAL